MHRFLFTLSFLLAPAAAAWAQPSSHAEQIAAIFRPYQTDQAALAPDGKHLAYSEKRGDRLFLILVNLDTRTARELPLISDIYEPLSGNPEKTPSRLTFLRWANPHRVVACIQDEVLIAVDADGRNAKRLLNENDLVSLTEFTRDRANSFQLRPVVFQTPSMSSSVDLATLDITGSAAETPEGDGNRIGTDFENDVTADVFDSVQGGRISTSIRPHVLELLADEPDCIIVEARLPIGPTDDTATPNAAGLFTSIFKVNIVTGKTTTLAEEQAASRVVCDKQGHPRLALTHFSNTREFLLARTPNAVWKEMDKLLGPTEALAFQFSPENFLGRRSFPLGFDYDPNILYFASNVAADTYGIYSLDLRTMKRGAVAIRNPKLDLADLNEPLAEDALVFDRHRRNLVGVRVAGLSADTSWIDPELAALQAILTKKHPERMFEILDWDSARRRFLILGSSHSDPGAYYVYDREGGRLSEYARRAPWINPARANATIPFAFKSPAGIELTGYLTLPFTPRVKPVPLLVYCHDGPWGRDLPGYNRGAQALATMGFAVAQINFRGSSGFGYQHMVALQQGFDRVALDDVLASMDWIMAHFKINPKLVAILGNGYGGYLALRALELYPDRFRCAVSINAPTKLAAWLNQPEIAYSFKRDVRRTFFGHDDAKLDAASPLYHADAITAPVLIVHGEQDVVVPVRHGLSMRDALAHKPEPAQFLELRTEGHSYWLPGSYSRVFQSLEDFFNLNVYQYATKLGEARVQP